MKNVHVKFVSRWAAMHFYNTHQVYKECVVRADGAEAQYQTDDINFYSLLSDLYVYAEILDIWEE